MVHLKCRDQLRNGVLKKKDINRFEIKPGFNAVVKNDTERSYVPHFPSFPQWEHFPKLKYNNNTRIWTLIQSIALVQLCQFFLYLFVYKNSVLLMFVV